MPLTCSVCADTGLLLLAERCPLCEGFGRDGQLAWERASTPLWRARLLLCRILRTGMAQLTADERQDLASLLLRSKRGKRRQRRTRGPPCFLLAPAQEAPPATDATIMETVWWGPEKSDVLPRRLC